MWREPDRLDRQTWSLGQFVSGVLGLGGIPGRVGGRAVYSEIQNAATDGHFLEFRCGFDACTLPICTTNGSAAKRIRSKDHTGRQYDHFYYRLLVLKGS